ncbi:type VII secretion system-associated protein [Nocardia sp. NRRL S-836]|uniref:type VII secretion system-associated protein n=1 Tax=Nocardia sp. NRRL S-836 TaxID=1519492 RepID=UPI000B1978B4|nr:type VII secretion system-associated protein [Nocardia sp. NRRL S-836]
MTDSTAGRPEHSALGNWFLLMDPAWSPRHENEPPPLEAVVGVWPLADDGGVGKFRPNPDHVPADSGAPSDPLDAVFRLVSQGRAETEQLRLMLRDSLFDIAVNGDGRPLVTLSPDDVPCVVVATGEAQRRRVSSPQWRRIDLDDLVVLLADGVDVLFNPGGPAALRLTGDFLRETLVMAGDEVADLHARGRRAAELRVVRWEPENGG